MSMSLCFVLQVDRKALVVVRSCHLSLKEPFSDSTVRIYLGIYRKLQNGG